MVLRRASGLEIKALKAGNLSGEIENVGELVKAGLADSYVFMTNMSVDAPVSADTVTLRDRIAALNLPPAKAVGAASALIEGIAATKISGEEERYSRTDLWDFQANIEGSKAVFGLLRPLFADRDFVARVERSYKRIEDVLARYRLPEGGFQSYDSLSVRDRNALKGPITLLAEDLSTLRGRLGID